MVAGADAPHSSAYSPAVHPAESRQLRAAPTYLSVELGNSCTASPAKAGRENASVQDGGRRRRRSPTLGGNGQDMVKVRQGKPNKKIVNRCSKESRGRQLGCWCA